MINVIAAAQASVLAAGGEGAEEMPSVLAVPIDELIIGIIAFLIVFGGLAKFALPNIKKTLAERADAIEGGIERAAKAEADNAPKKKLSYKDQRELEGLPALIQQLESQQKAIEQELYDGSLYTRDAKRAAELNARNSKIEEALMEALQRWETLSA